KGCHTGMVGLHCVAEPVPNMHDTCVQRLQSMCLSSIGDTATVDIRLRALSLKSEDPIRVTYGGGSPNFFDIFVTLDQAAPQCRGSATFTQTGETTLNLEVLEKPGLPVNFQARFVNQNIQGPPGPQIRDRDLLHTISPWQLERTATTKGGDNSKA